MVAQVVKIYNVFHEKVFKELLEDVPKDDRSSITLYGVNDKIKKDITDVVDMGFNILMESSLPIFDAMYQEERFRETSCMIHIFQNSLHKHVNYIGFCQYDMKLGKDAIKTISECKGLTIFHEQTCSVHEAFQNYTGLQHVIDHYNAFFQTNIRLQEFLSCSIPFPLVNTFAMPSNMFGKMMTWVCNYIPTTMAPHPYPFNHSRGEVFERIHGLFIVLETIQSLEPIPYVRMDVHHMWPHYHNMCPFEGYKC